MGISIQRKTGIFVCIHHKDCLKYLKFIRRLIQSPSHFLYKSMDNGTFASLFKNPPQERPQRQTPPETVMPPADSAPIQDTETHLPMKIESELTLEKPIMEKTVKKEIAKIMPKKAKPLPKKPVKTSPKKKKVVAKKAQKKAPSERSTGRAGKKTKVTKKKAVKKAPKKVVKKAKKSVKKVRKAAKKRR